MKIKKTFLIALVFVSQLTAAYAVSNVTTHIGITKLATLQVSGMDTDEFYIDQASNELRSNTCLQTGGEPVPYRISARSLHGKSGFAATNEASQSQIGYDVIWSGSTENYRLHGSTDISEVIQADSKAGCDYHSLAIDSDDGAFASASLSSHIDTLSLIFVIE